MAARMWCLCRASRNRVASNRFLNGDPRPVSKRLIPHAAERASVGRTPARTPRPIVESLRSRER